LAQRESISEEHSPLIPTSQKTYDLLDSGTEGVLLPRTARKSSEGISGRPPLSLKRGESRSSEPVRGTVFKKDPPPNLLDGDL